MDKQINKRKIFFPSYELITNKIHKRDFYVKNIKTRKVNKYSKLFLILVFIFVSFCFLFILLFISIKLIFPHKPRIPKKTRIAIETKINKTTKITQKTKIDEETKITVVSALYDIGEKKEKEILIYITNG